MRAVFWGGVGVNFPHREMQVIRCRTAFIAKIRKHHKVIIVLFLSFSLLTNSIPFIYKHYFFCLVLATVRKIELKNVTEMSQMNTSTRIKKTDKASERGKHLRM